MILLCFLYLGSHSLFVKELPGASQQNRGSSPRSCLLGYKQRSDEHADPGIDIWFQATNPSKSRVTRSLSSRTWSLGTWDLGCRDKQRDLCKQFRDPCYPIYGEDVDWLKPFSTLHRKLHFILRCFLTYWIARGISRAFCFLFERLVQFCIQVRSSYKILSGNLEAAIALCTIRC